jgi:hypothetical protein
VLPLAKSAALTASRGAALYSTSSRDMSEEVHHHLPTLCHSAHTSKLPAGSHMMRHAGTESHHAVPPVVLCHWPSVTRSRLPVDSSQAQMNLRQLMTRCSTIQQHCCLPQHAAAGNRTEHQRQHHASDSAGNNSKHAIKQCLQGTSRLAGVARVAENDVNIYHQNARRKWLYMWGAGPMALMLWLNLVI